MSAFKNLAGMKFGRLTVIDRAENGICCGKPVTKWRCQCECGSTVTVEGHSLRRGRTKSCGCWNSEVRKREIVRRSTTHGESHMRLYHIWASMHQRCENPNTERYQNYGGRGISVCDAWRKYDGFRRWAYENGYSDILTIDRIDVNGNYEPSNCRWATMEEQQNNKQNNRMIEFEGKIMTLSEWAKRTGINLKTLHSRIFMYRWDVNKALTLPIGRRNIYD